MSYRKCIGKTGRERKETEKKFYDLYTFVYVIKTPFNLGNLPA